LWQPFWAEIQRKGIGQIMGRFSVGGNADSWCTKCKLVLAHTVVAMVEKVPVKAQCNTCGSTHKFRSDSPKSRATGSKEIKEALRSKSKRLSAGMVKANHYQELMAGRDPSTAKTYSPKSTFEKGDLVRHVKFGLGLVTVLKDHNKIEILFEEGAKVLVCAGAS
tara:strand:+ start:877 stop:1368 length:492 start_codon:yes stop_codon:yes gene_type:complete